jgi:hypothetical protein
VGKLEKWQSCTHSQKVEKSKSGKSQKVETLQDCSKSRKVGKVEKSKSQKVEKSNTSKSKTVEKWLGHFWWTSVNGTSSGKRQTVGSARSATLGTPYSTAPEGVTNNIVSTLGCQGMA